MKLITHLLFICFLHSSFLHANDEAEMLKDNIIIVLDASGSMNEKMGQANRMEIAKQAIITVVQTLDKNSNIGMLVFSGANKQSDWLHNLGPLNLNLLKANLQKLRPSGGTPLGAYMNVAKQALVAQRKKQLGYGTYRMLILTDGQASDNKTVLKETPLVLGNGIYLDVIGVAMNNSHTLATRANSYRSAMDQKALMKAMETVFSEVSDKADQKETKETFEILAPLDHKVAALMIKGLASNKNDLRNMIADAKGPSSSPKPITQSKPEAAAPQAVSPKPTKEKGSNNFFIYMIVFAVAVSFFVSRKK